MNPAIALAILLSSHSDRNVTGLCGCTSQPAPQVVVVERRQPTSAAAKPQVPTAPSNFNYGRSDGQFPVLVELTGSVQVKK